MKLKSCEDSSNFLILKLKDIKNDFVVKHESSLQVFQSSFLICKDESDCSFF